MPASPELVETNFVQLDVSDVRLTSAQAIERLAAGRRRPERHDPAGRDPRRHAPRRDRRGHRARDRGRPGRARHRRSRLTVLQAVLFDWGETLCHFEWDDELLAAGHAAGLEALGRGAEADEFTARFAAERLPALLADGAAEQLDYGAELRALLGERERRGARPLPRRRARRVAPGAGARQQRARAARDAARPQPPPRDRRQQLARAGAARAPRARRARRDRARRPHRPLGRGRRPQAVARDLRARARPARARPARGAPRGRPPGRRRRRRRRPSG